jgi:hypothetical protein
LVEGQCFILIYELIYNKLFKNIFCSIQIWNVDCRTFCVQEQNIHVHVVWNHIEIIPMCMKIWAIRFLSLKYFKRTIANWLKHLICQWNISSQTNVNGSVDEERSIFLGAVVAVIIWKLDSQLPMQSVPITTNVVSSNLDQVEVYNIMWLWWFPPDPGPPVSSANKTDLHNIIEILLKVALNTT